MDDIFLDLDEIEELNLDNKFVLKSHEFAEKLKKRGINIKKPIWENFKAS